MICYGLGRKLFDFPRYKVITEMQPLPLSMKLKSWDGWILLDAMPDSVAIWSAQRSIIIVAFADRPEFSQCNSQVSPYLLCWWESQEMEESKYAADSNCLCELPDVHSWNHCYVVYAVPPSGILAGQERWSNTVGMRSWRIERLPDKTRPCIISEWRIRSYKQPSYR